MDVLLYAAIGSIVVLGLFIGGMVLGVFLRGKPIQHCGGASMEYKGTKIDCPACANKGACKLKKKKKRASVPPAQAVSDNV